ncbi:MAG: sugar ABC transporter permease [Microcella sp.]|uniref:carbohydrate ABC transporter permease n=1 Tax=Microcella sp. TaxID=1913979 RepID=UPI0033146EE9
MSQLALATSPRSVAERGDVAPNSPGRTHTARRREAVTGFLFILPLFATVSLFMFYPIIRNTYLSFTETGVFGGETWTGLDQYIRLVQDPQMWMAIRNTGLYALIGLLGIPLALIIAGLLNRPGLRFKSLFRVIYFLPVVVMPVAIGMIWRLLFNDDYGIINSILNTIGLSSVQWLSDPVAVIFAIGFVAVWSTLGFNVVLMLAGLQAVPRDVIEAAVLDGAGPIRQFFSVTVPIISPTVFMVSVLTVISSLQIFDLVFIMIGRNSPAIDDSQTIVYYFYEQGVVLLDRGYAAAIVTILLILTMIVTAIQFRLQKRWVHYGS